MAIFPRAAVFEVRNQLDIAPDALPVTTISAKSVFMNALNIVGRGLRGLPAGVLIAAGIATLSAQAAHGASDRASSAGAPVILVPHRAVYDFTLESARPGAGVTDMSGRMVYLLDGSSCEGYTQETRFVSLITNPRGRTITTDMRSSSWEAEAGRRYRFHATQHRNNRLSQTTTVDARRRPGTGEVKVTLTKPRKRRMALERQVLFPVQHSIELIRMARAGKLLFQADLYDGSERGEKVYATTSVIGRPLGKRGNADLPKVKNGKKLDGVESWPVAISYFDSRKVASDQLPAYEFSFRFFANGVSRHLLISYGDFSIRGVLREIEFLDQGKCPKRPG